MPTSAEARIPGFGNQMDARWSGAEPHCGHADDRRTGLGASPAGSTRWADIDTDVGAAPQEENADWEGAAAADHMSRQDFKGCALGASLDASAVGSLFSKPFLPAWESDPGTAPAVAYFAMAACNSPTEAASWNSVGTKELLEWESAGASAGNAAAAMQNHAVMTTSQAAPAAATAGWPFQQKRDGSGAVFASTPAAATQQQVACMKALMASGCQGMAPPPGSYDEKARQKQLNKGGRWGGPDAKAPPMVPSSTANRWPLLLAGQLQAPPQVPSGKEVQEQLSLQKLQHLQSLQRAACAEWFRQPFPLPAQQGQQGQQFQQGQQGQQRFEKGRGRGSKEGGRRSTESAQATHMAQGGARRSARGGSSQQLAWVEETSGPLEMHSRSGSKGSFNIGAPDGSVPIASPSDEQGFLVQKDQGLSSAGGGTIKTQLQLLQLEDPACVFIARRINKLSFQSAEILRWHFSQYGEVKNVYVSHSRVKATRLAGERRVPHSHWRLRAAALGFVVMSKPEETAAILAAGGEHEVNGQQVRVQQFCRRTSTLGMQDGEDEEDINNYAGDVDPDVKQPDPTSGALSAPMAGAAAAVGVVMCHDLASPDPSSGTGESSSAGGFQAFSPQGMYSSAYMGQAMCYVSAQELQAAMPAHYED